MTTKKKLTHEQRDALVGLAAEDIQRQVNTGQAMLAAYNVRSLINDLPADPHPQEWALLAKRAGQLARRARAVAGDA